jgi:hypothetical protein
VKISSGSLWPDCLGLVPKTLECRPLDRWVIPKLKASFERSLRQTVNTYVLIRKPRDCTEQLHPKATGGVSARHSLRQANGEIS